MNKPDAFIEQLVAVLNNITNLKMQDRANVAQVFANSIKDTRKVRDILGKFGYYRLSDLARFYELTPSGMSRRLESIVLPVGSMVTHNDKPYYFYQK